MTVKCWVFPKWVLLKSSPFGNPQRSHIQGEECTAEALGCTLPHRLADFCTRTFVAPFPWSTFDAASCTPDSTLDFSRSLA